MVGSEHRSDILGIELLGAAREADEVREEDSDDLALLPRRSGNLVEGRRARRAEAEALGALLSAVWADHDACKRTVRAMEPRRPTSHPTICRPPRRL
jgi:hypothetical protein